MDMTWTISHIPEGNIIHNETTGDMTVPTVNQMAKEAKEAGELHRSKSLLFDHRKLSSALDILRMYDRPKELSNMSFPQTSQISIVTPVSLLKQFTFYEDVMFNRGYMVRVFTDFNLAKEWLSRDSTRYTYRNVITDIDSARQWLTP